MSTTALLHIGRAMSAIIRSGSASSVQVRSSQARPGQAKSAPFRPGSPGHSLAVYRPPLHGVCAGQLRCWRLCRVHERDRRPARAAAPRSPLLRWHLRPKPATGGGGGGGGGGGRWTTEDGGRWTAKGIDGGGGRTDAGQPAEVCVLSVCGSEERVTQ